LTRPTYDLSSLSSELDRALEDRVGFEGVLSRIAEIAKSQIGWSAVLIRAIEPITRSFVVVHKQGSEEFFSYLSRVRPIRGTLGAEVVRTRKPILVHSHNPASAPDPEVFARHLFDRGVKSAIFIPIFQGSIVIGVLAVTTEESDHFNDETLKALEIVCEAIGTVLHDAGRNISAVPDPEDMSQLVTLDQIGELLSSRGELSTVFQRFAKLAAELIPYDRIAILHYLNNGLQGETAFVACAPLGRFVVGARHPIPREGTENWLSKTNAFLPEESTAEVSLFQELFNPNAEPNNFNSWMVAPIVWDQKLIGEIHFR
jgi:GAF domain-containing protein